VGDVVHGKILRTAQFGAFVEIAEGVEGLCHVSEAGDGPDGQGQLEQGSEHDFKIIKINVEEKKKEGRTQSSCRKRTRGEPSHCGKLQGGYAQASRLKLHDHAGRSCELAQEREVRRSSVRINKMATLRGGHFALG
jgi:predicted RNA-binding protein with RPS1 domain